MSDSRSTKKAAERTVELWLDRVRTRNVEAIKVVEDEDVSGWPSSWERAIYESVPNPVGLERANLIQLRARRIFGRRRG